VNAFPIKFLREFDDAYRIERTFLDAYSTAGAEFLVNDRLLFARHELNRIPSIEYLGAESVARYSTVVRFAMFFVKCGYT
jgi:hypothetical protein